MLLEDTVAKGDVVTFNTPSEGERCILAATRDANGQITSIIKLRPWMNERHGFEVYEPSLMLAAINHRHPKVEKFTLSEVKDALHTPFYPSPAQARLIPLSFNGQEDRLIASISEQVKEFIPEFSYDDITVSMKYADVWFRYICDDNPKDCGDCIDEEDAHKLLNCVLIATIARQNTEPFANRFTEWELAMTNFVKELTDGDGVKIRKDSKALKWFMWKIDEAGSFDDLRPNN